MRVDEGDKINILGIDLHRVDYEEACKRVSDYLKLNTCRIIVTPNAEIIMAARKDKEIKTLINSSDICLPDGIGVVLASKILGKPLSERTT
ncbi:MAG TPA: glycosyltransferase, partial [Thermoanaerobacterales bacterium]|nr:glycosyltransferase [Thermoanaerobacterales bacterium]